LAPAKFPDLGTHFPETIPDKIMRLSSPDVALLLVLKIYQ
jgi:hypothetical protein